MFKTKIKWNSERVLSLTAMVLSFVTLIIFIYQTNLMRRQNYLSILPYIQFATHNNQVEKSFALSLKNHGVGPAILESVTIEYRDRKYDLAKYDNELVKLLTTMAPELDSIRGYAFSTLDKGVAIPANSTYVIMEIKKAPQQYELFTRNLQKLLDNGLQYTIVYKSIQDEHWMIQNNSDGPIKLN